VSGGVLGSEVWFDRAGLDIAEIRATDRARIDHPRDAANLGNTASLSIVPGIQGVERQGAALVDGRGRSSSL